MESNWLKWMTFFCGLLVFVVFSAVFMETADITTGAKDILIISGIIFFPALIVSFLALFRQYWFQMPFGIWFIFYGFRSYQTKFSILNSFVIAFGLVLPGLILFFAPFVNKFADE